jgi:hypothetical protein
MNFTDIQNIWIIRNMIKMKLKFEDMSHKGFRIYPKYMLSQLMLPLSHFNKASLSWLYVFIFPKLKLSLKVSDFE